MQFIRTLKEVHRSDRELVGERAVDLALLSEKGFRVPISFVLTNRAFEAFIEQNKLQSRIAQALQDIIDPNHIYDTIRELFLTGTAPKEMVAEIVEAYESLSIDESSSVSEIVVERAVPVVNVMLSSNFTPPTENREGIILNVRNLEELLVAIKECWSCLFTPSMQRYRKEAEIGHSNLNIGIIVQQMGHGEVSAEAESGTQGNPEELRVRAYYGALDIGGDVEKDEFRIAREYLKPVYQHVGTQSMMLARDEHEKLGRVPLGVRGEEQKLNDREMIELGRLAKKASNILEKHVELLFTVQQHDIKTLLCNTLLLTKGSVKLQGYEAEERIVETEEAVVAVDEESGEEEVLSQEAEVFEDAPPAHPDVLSEDLLQPSRPTVEPENAAPIAEEAPEEIIEEVPEESLPDEAAVVQEEAPPEESAEVYQDSVEEAETIPPEEEMQEQPKEVHVEEVVEEVYVEEVPDSTQEMNEDAEEAEAEHGETDVAAEEESEDDSIFAGVVVEESPAVEADDVIKEQAAPEAADEAGEDEHEPWTIEEAYERIVAALRHRYEARFRNLAPEKATEMFFELSGEIIIPHEEQIGKLLRLQESEEGLSAEEEEEILAVVDPFLEQFV